ncbi:hypothetical protein DFH09DRAFT_562910 [Mycena vulgaris]|nr:hypothetical protein DFH09DRAFT_562910 [Mycena vulgaris]
MRYFRPRRVRSPRVDDKPQPCTLTQIWGISAAIGACLCMLVLGLIIVLYVRSSTRPFLDRVSFRIMVYALACNMLYGISTAVCAFQTADSVACGFSVWLIMMTLQFGSWLIFGIALNLQLVLVHGVNGHIMEKYYILAALTIALCVTIPPLASHQYGWDELNGACWMTAADQKKRLRWQLGSQLIWSLLAAVGEAIVFLIVLSYMFRHQIVHGSRIRSDSRSTRSDTQVGAPYADPKTKVINHAAQYRSVIIRISFYPMVSIALNGITVACDLYLSVTGSISSQRDMNVAILNNLMYGIRPVIYALLAISDPALMRAMRSVLNEARGRKDNTTGNSSSGGPSHATGGASQGQITVHIEPEEVRQTDDGDTLPPMSPLGSAHKSPLGGMFGKAEEGLVSGDDLPNRLSVLRRGHVQRAKEAKAAAAVAREERKDFKTQI